MPPEAASHRPAHPPSIAPAAASSDDARPARPGEPPALPVRIVLLTLLALVAFAANSLLCRAALADDLIDAASFTAVRLGSGALVLVLLVARRGRRAPDAARPRRLDPAASLMLFGYAAGFSYAYLGLGAGTGALILFACVQAAMFTASVARGSRPHPGEWIGLVVALGGLAWLVAPGLDAPAPLAAALMAVAGLAWGGYSLRGRGATDPVGRTAGNFVGAVPLAAVLLAGHALAAGLDATPSGLGLAITSGAVTSGLGYVVWYAALPGLTAIRAALVQLSVPVLTAIAAIPLLAEPPTWRLVGGGGLIVGGIAVAILVRRSPARR